ncbi:caspase family protein [Aquimarina sp. 2201CG5-10]|uniref:caspase family protein n=1 Tax=Aquimarina callyspongiae TaxID=3098150 RepID=UPI002AB443D2|nr:caspase family protein [Aquimarina sp. 2201CG5-10]MDY8134677.1 caspase family protein [Aquimarina sp. 2201CG5-10]
MNLENAHALLIGVGGDNIGITVDDATAIADVLTDPQKASYKEENVCLLTDEKATRYNILEKLHELVKITENRPESTVFIYYSGHGGRDKKNNKYYLLPNGYDMNNKIDTMIEGNEFSRLVNQIKAERLLLILDCCHASGILINGKSVIAKNQNIEISSSNIELINRLNTGEGKVFITSCDDDEQSYILNNAKNSLFTEVLLEALEGKVSKGRSYVSMLDIIYHTGHEVFKRIQKYAPGYKQRPIYKCIENLSPDFYICKANILEETIENYFYSKKKLQKLLEEQGVSTSNYTFHILHQYPKGPLVDAYLIDDSIMEAYARAITSKKAHRFIKKANRLRLSADPDDKRTTIIDPSCLIPNENAAPIDVWENIFDTARLHGPRMLAALLLVVPNDKLKEDVREETNRLLERLKTHK